MGEALRHAGESDTHLQLQTQIAESTADKTAEGLIPQQRQVSEEMMAIGRASREAFMKSQLRELQLQNIKAQQSQYEKKRWVVANILAKDESRWYEFAKCKDSKFDYFPEDNSNIYLDEKMLKRIAKTACSGCLVKDACLKDELKQGVDYQWGIRGGTTRLERRSILLKNPTLIITS